VSVRRNLAEVNDTAEVRAAGLLLRRDAGGCRWLLLRNRKRREWGFPKGHADAGESDLATALRECAEECGIALVAVDGDVRELRYALGGGRVKSVAYFPAVTASLRCTLSHEHDQAGWFSADEVLRRLPHDSLKALFRAHVRDLRA
jgi:8-oxo-dGTP pyrophosphatase MutT (NUDIX family)